MLRIYTLAWFPMVLIAVANGSLRQFGYAPYLSELAAHQISCFTAVIFFAAYTWLLSRRWPLPGAAQAFAVGGIWLLLTVAFEFLFGLYVAGHSLERLLADYNILAGRLWVFVLAAVALLPYGVYRLSPSAIPLKTNKERRRDDR
ncbi:MAG TPA: hypothetical protein PK090_10895 [Smithellaceae bacterium]|jgi:hypothetical protein|nr:hypothetical protein [Smithellaceae bacterium]